MDYRLRDDTLLITDLLANHDNVGKVETPVNSDGCQCEDSLGCARGVLAGVAIQVIVIFAGAVFWWVLR